ARAQALDGRSDIYSLGVAAYQCLTGSVPFDGEDSFSIGYKHIMEEVPLPPLETYDQRTLFEIIRKMMAKGPDDRFQSADELVNALEAGGGFAAVGLSTAPTRAIPSLAGAALAGAPTTPTPRPPPGRLTLQGLPAGAQITLNGQPFRTQGDVPPGTYKLAVRAAGFAPYERPLVITAGAPLTVKVELESATVAGGEDGSGPCEVFG